MDKGWLKNTTLLLQKHRSRDRFENKMESIHKFEPRRRFEQKRVVLSGSHVRFGMRRFEIKQSFLSTLTFNLTLYRFRFETKYWLNLIVNDT